MAKMAGVVLSSVGEESWFAMPLCFELELGQTVLGRD
jgi:hypothetical protein